MTKTVGKYLRSKIQIQTHAAARNSPNTLLRRKEWVEKWSQTDMNYLSKYVFVDKSAYDINMKPLTARSAKVTVTGHYTLFL